MQADGRRSSSRSARCRCGRWRRCARYSACCATTTVRATLRHSQVSTCSTSWLQTSPPPDSTSPFQSRASERLVLSEHTVKTHVARILTKLTLRDRAQMIVYAYETGMGRPGG
ncbi:helix-turn-helix transcriptional regulator [Mycolicibacterium komossense]|uniref:Helix-turn-helix transcriptional regulator n=1 Tax=Mycolicibacterium komossense TaxID=1779 RepID=A0ABT3CAY1_9MYCO|nr:helix-turn-helix transcriptional regulator [Mycolicibacterium komossense]